MFVSPYMQISLKILFCILLFLSSRSLRSFWWVCRHFLTGRKHFKAIWIFAKSPKNVLCVANISFVGLDLKKSRDFCVIWNFSNMSNLWKGIETQQSNAWMWHTHENKGTRLKFDDRQVKKYHQPSGTRNFGFGRKSFLWNAATKTNASGKCRDKSSINCILKVDLKPFYLLISY